MNPSTQPRSLYIPDSDAPLTLRRIASLVRQLVAAVDREPPESKSDFVHAVFQAMKIVLPEACSHLKESAVQGGLVAMLLEDWQWMESACPHGDDDDADDNADADANSAADPSPAAVVTPEALSEFIHKGETALRCHPDLLLRHINETGFGEFPDLSLSLHLDSVARSPAVMAWQADIVRHGLHIRQRLAQQPHLAPDTNFALFQSYGETLVEGCKHLFQHLVADVGTEDSHEIENPFISVPIPPIMSTEEAPPTVVAPPSERRSTTILNRSQQAAFKRMLSMGKVFFGLTNAQRGIIRPRLFPLLAGPTGAGKSHICRQLARALKADYLPLTFGDWIVTGSKEGIPTTRQILLALAKTDRLIVHIDELDKWVGHGEGGWSASASNSLWNVLDLSFSKDDLRPAGPEASNSFSPRLLQRKIKENLWIIGSGTWQHLFEKDTKPAIGFGESRAASSDADMMDSILASQMIPPELTARFHQDLLILNYPDPDELKELLDVTGLSELARLAGVSVSPDNLRIRSNGMRSLESLKADLLIRIQEQAAQSTETPALSLS